MIYLYQVYRSTLNVTLYTLKDILAINIFYGSNDGLFACRLRFRGFVCIIFLDAKKKNFSFN